MGVVFKQSSRTTIISYFGVVIGYFNVLWLFPAILSAEEIGLIRLLPSVALVLLPFTQLGLSQSVLKFYPQFKERPGGENELLSFMIVASTVGFGITLIFLSIFKGQIHSFFSSKSPLANEYLHVAVILILVISYQAIFEAFSRSILKIIFPGIIKDVVVRLLFSFAVGLYFIDIISFATLVNGLIVIYVTALLLLASYVIKKSGFGPISKFKVLRKPDIQQILKYSVFTLLGASGNYIILNIDQLMISNLVGLDANGIYTTAVYIAVVIEMPRRAMANITTPLVSQFFKLGKLAEINKLYKQVSINQMVVGGLLLIGILVNLDNLFTLIPNNNVYLAGMNVVFFVGLAKLLDMTFGNNSEIILMSRYYKYNVIFTLGLAIVAVVSNWFLIQLYGINGAAIATAMTLLLFNIVKLLFVKYKMQLWPFQWNSLALLIIGLATYMLVVLIPFMFNTWVDIVLRSIITTALYMSPVLILKISPEINRVARKVTGITFPLGQGE